MRLHLLMLLGAVHPVNRHQEYDSSSGICGSFSGTSDSEGGAVARLGRPCTWMVGDQSVAHRKGKLPVDAVGWAGACSRSARREGGEGPPASHSGQLSFGGSRVTSRLTPGLQDRNRLLSGKAPKMRASLPRAPRPGAQGAISSHLSRRRFQEFVVAHA